MVASTWTLAGWDAGFPLPEIDCHAGDSGNEGGNGGGRGGGCGGDDGVKKTPFSSSKEVMIRRVMTQEVMMKTEPDTDFAGGGMDLDRFELLGEPFDAESFVDRLVDDDPPPWRAAAAAAASAGFPHGGLADQGPIYHNQLWEAPPLTGYGTNIAQTIADTGSRENSRYNNDDTWTPTGGRARAAAAPPAAKLFLQPAINWSQAQAVGDRTLGLGPASANTVADTMPAVVPHDPILDALLFTPAKMTPEIMPTVTSHGLWDGSGYNGPTCCNSGSGSGFPRAAADGGSVADAACDSFHPLMAPAPVPSVAPSQLVVPGAPSRPQRQLSFGYNSIETAATASCDTSLVAPQQYYQHQQQQLLPSVFALHQQHSGLGQQSQQETDCGWIGGEGAGIGTDALKRTPLFRSDSDSGVAGITGAFSDGIAASPAPLTGADSYTEEYDDERHAFLRQQELANFVGPGYLAGAGLPGLVTPIARTTLVDWLSRLHHSAPAASGGGPPLSLETFFLAVNVVDRFLSTAEGARTAYLGGPALKLVATASLALASKYEDTQPISLWGVTAAANTGACAAAPDAASVGRSSGGSSICGDCSIGMEVGCKFGGCSNGNSANRQTGEVDVTAARKEVAAMEMHVVSALGFRLTVPTALSFLGVFLRRAVGLGYLSKGQVVERVRQEAQQILLCVLRDASSLEHPPSALAAAALYWASCVSCPGEAAPAFFAFFAVTGYQLDKLCRCLRDMENVRTGGFASTNCDVIGNRHFAAQWDAGAAHGDASGSSVGGGMWAGAAFPEHAANSLFGAGGGHPAIAAL